jgi:hypothetical protein
MNKKLPKGTILFGDPIYCQDYLIVVSPTHAKFRKIVKEIINYDIEKDEEDNTAGSFFGISNPKLGDLGILWTKNRQSVLVHEIFHLVAWTLRRRDICLDSESSEEAYAYYFGYIYREIKDRLNRAK